jgi:TonB family protein
MRAAAGRRTHRFAVPTAIAVAVLIHLSVLGTVEALDLTIIGAPFSHAKHVDEVAAPQLKSSCSFDVMLATGARAAACFAPWNDPDACLSELPANYYIDLSACSRRYDRNERAQDIALIEPKAIEKLKPIDAEPLLEALKEQEKPKPQTVPPPLPQPQPPPPPPVQARRQPMQVVETAKPTTEQAPDNARFLSEYDTRAEHQTVARGTPKEPMIAKSKPSELAPKEQPKEASVKEHPDKPPGHVGAPDVPGSLAMRDPGAPSSAEAPQDARTRGALGGATGPTAFDGFVPRRGDGAIEQQQHQRTETAHGQNGAGGGAPDTPNLKPSQDVLERALGGGNVDHMDDVDNGDETALNSKRWIFASFFNRLKRSVAQNWDPASVWRRVDPTGQVNGFKTRVTEVRVSLTPKGELTKIVVTTPSGVGELDDEAVRAFHSAAPFPNPPKELVGSDGAITFAFAFFFEIGSPHTTWRVLHGM